MQCNGGFPFRYSSAFPNAMQATCVAVKVLCHSTCTGRFFFAFEVGLAGGALHKPSSGTYMDANLYHFMCFPLQCCSQTLVTVSALVLLRLQAHFCI